jgi:hypothetical protein
MARGAPVGLISTVPTPKRSARAATYMGPADTGGRNCRLDQIPNEYCRHDHPAKDRQQPKDVDQPVIHGCSPSPVIIADHAGARFHTLSQCAEYSDATRDYPPNIGPPSRVFQHSGKPLNRVIPAVCPQGRSA